MTTKKLYKIWQEVNNDYDTYDSAVVCAESVEEARNIDLGTDEQWVKHKDVKVKEIGIANDDEINDLLLKIEGLEIEIKELKRENRELGNEIREMNKIMGDRNE